MVELRLLFAIYYLDVGEGSLRLGVPVDHAQTAIYEPLLVEVAEYTQDALAAFLVHGEGCAVPVATRSETTQLLEDYASVLVSPVPGMAQKLFASEILLAYALLSQAVYHLSFGGDAGMVCPGHPARILALQTCAAYEYVLDARS